MRYNLGISHYQMYKGWPEGTGVKERGARSVYVARGDLGSNNEREGRSIEIAMGQHRTLGKSPGAAGSLPCFVNLNSLGSAMGKRMGAGGEKYASKHVLGRIFPLVNRVNGDILRGCIRALAE